MYTSFIFNIKNDKFINILILINITMESFTRKIYKNNSNGQLLITAPKFFNEGDEVILTLSKNAYEIILERNYSLELIGDNETSIFLQSKLNKLFNDDLEDYFCNGILEETLYESWEDMSIMGVELDFKINIVNKSTIDFTLRLTKKKNYNAPNEEMIKVLRSLLEDKDKLFDLILDYIKQEIDFTLK